MAAGTVISGGFPGRVAQEVQPNPKCNGCLHFDGQLGRIGACTIGSKPWLCGDGDAADIGYAPLTRGAGKYLPDMNTHGAHAHVVGDQDTSDLYGAGSTRAVTFQQVSLSEEHVHFAKSFITRHDILQKSMCRLCKSANMIGMAPANVGPQVCTCETISARDVAKALAPRLSNLEASVVSMNDLTAFVYECAKANFNPKMMKATFSHAHGKYEVSPASNGTGEQHVDFHPKGGGKPTRIATVGSRGAARATTETHARRFASGTGADNAAPHTTHNDDVNTGKHESKSTRTPVGLPSMRGATSVARKSLKWYGGASPEHIDASAAHGSYTTQPTKLGHSVTYIPKDKDSPIEHLGHHESKVAAIKKIDAHHAEVHQHESDWKVSHRPHAEIGKKSFDEEDVEKAIDNTKHSHIVSGRLAPEGRGYANVKQARTAVDKMDMKYGASAHSYKPNPNFKPATPSAGGTTEKSLDDLLLELHEEEDVEKSLRWSHKKTGQASTSHGKYAVAAHPTGGHTVTYTHKATGRTEVGHYKNHREALGALTEHHLKNRPPPKKRKPKAAKAPEPKQLTARAGAPAHCPPCS